MWWSIMMDWENWYVIFGIKIFLSSRPDPSQDPNFFASSAQRVPEPDPLPGISLDTRPDPIQF